MSLVTILVGWPVLSFGRVYEDHNGPRLVNGDVFTWQRVWTKPQRLLSDATFALTESNRVQHAVNLAGIVLTVAVVGVLLPTVWGMVLAGALVGWHPLQTEGIAYLSARPDVLVGLCLALGLWSVERRSVVGVLLASVCAFLSKESGVMVGPLLGLWSIARGWVSVGLIPLGALVGLLLGFLLLRYPVQPSIAPAAQVATLLGQLVWPFGLTIDYDWSGDTAQTGVLALVWLVTAVTVAWAMDRPLWAMGCVGLGVWFLPRVLVPLSEGLHAHHVTGVMPWIAVCLTYPQKLSIHDGD